MSIPKKKTAEARKPVFQFLLEPDVKKQMDKHDDINWSEVCRLAIDEALSKLRRRRRK